MQERYAFSEHIGDLAAALSAAQAEFPTIERNREVEVEKKKGGRYSFRYATLDAILDAVRPALSKQQMALTQTLRRDNGSSALTTMLIHGPTGQWIASEVPVPPFNGSLQELGSMLTYLRRYAASALLMVCPEEDDDGNRAEGNHIEERRQKPAANSRTRGKPSGSGNAQTRTTLGEKIRGHSNRLGITLPELTAYSGARFGCNPRDLDLNQQTTLLKILSQQKDRSAWEIERDNWLSGADSERIANLEQEPELVSRGV